MGLFRFIADMETYSKISKKYGLGAGLAYMDKRNMDDELKASNSQKVYENAIEGSKNDMKFNMTNYLRKHSYKYTSEDLDYLNGIISQVDYISNIENATSLASEWNAFCKKREYMYEIKECIKKNKDNMIGFIKEFNLGIDNSIIDKVSSYFESIENETNPEELKTKCEILMEYARRNIKKYKKIFKDLLEINDFYYGKQ